MPRQPVKRGRKPMARTRELAGPLSRRERKGGEPEDERDADRDIVIGRRLHLEEAEATDPTTKWKPLGRE